MLKRSFDIFLSLLGLLLLTPIFIVISVQIYRNMGLPIFFRQLRPGLNGQPFELIKFRTMKNSYDSSGIPLSDAERITDFGMWLRSSSLDELPELWNVLCGDMSLVGPRPLLMEYLSLYSNQQINRHNVRPGITGWAQVNGRNTLSWEDKFSLDLWYVANYNFSLDIKILFLTIKLVLAKEGIMSSQGGMMSKFKGNLNKDGGE